MPSGNNKIVRRLTRGQLYLEEMSLDVGNIFRDFRNKLLESSRESTPIIDGGNLGGITVIGSKSAKKKPYKWVSPTGAGNMTFTGNSVAIPFLKGMNFVGEGINNALAGLATSPQSSTGYYQSIPIQGSDRVLQEIKNTMNEKVWPVLSPVNYATALISEGSLDPYKGQEIRSTWSPAAQAFIGVVDMVTAKKAGQGVRYVGRNTFSGLRNFGNLAIDVAGQYGNKTARGWSISRAINDAVKDTNPRVTRVPSKNLFRTMVFKGGDITDPYSSFFTTDRAYASKYGNVTPYIFESKSIAKAREPLMGARDPVSMDMFIYNNTKNNPAATAIIGHDAVTGEFTPSKGVEIYSMSPNNIFPILLRNPLTSLKFFERPSKLSEAERAGVSRGERFIPRWHVANYPGYLLKGLMKGSPLERQLSKTGTININQLNAYFNKASQIERDIASKVLNEQFAGLKVIDYNKFKKAILDELVTYNRNYNAMSMIPAMTTEKMGAYGGDRIGIIKNFKDISDGAGGLLTTWDRELPVLFKLFTFETPKIGIGNRKHYSGQPIGHTRTYTNVQEPHILHIMESQSDWALKSLGLTKAEKTALKNIDDQLTSGLSTGFSSLEELLALKQAILDRASKRTEGISYLSLYLHDNYLQRLLQENLRYASELGQTKMRYPTSDTAAKILGYLKTDHAKINELSLLQMKLGELFENGEISWEEYDRLIDNINKQKRELIGKDYSPEHKTILKKYEGFPKLFLKLFKDLKVRTVTDAKGNTWYEVDVPKGYLSREWLFKQGGKLVPKNLTLYLK